MPQERAPSTASKADLMATNRNVRFVPTAEAVYLRLRRWHCRSVADA
jgi:hypothetical protein